MKKKLLTLLLSIAVILTSTVTVVAGEILTIEDVLGTVDFPTSKDSQWINAEKGAVIYFDTNDPKRLVAAYGTDLSNSTGICKTNNNVNKNADNNYEYPANTFNIKFIMENGKLSSVVISESEVTKNYCGTYVVSLTPISEVSFEYTDFDFSNFTFKLPESLDVTKYTVDTNTYQVGLIKGEEIVYNYDNTKGYWIKDGGDGSQCTPNINDIDKAFINFDIVASGDNIFAENVVKVIATKNGTATTKELSGAEGLFEEGFNFGTKKIECNLLFDALTIKEINIEYSGFDFLKLKMERPTVPSDAKYEIDSYTLCLLNGSDPVAYMEGSDDTWYDAEMENPIDPSKLDFDKASISMSLFIDDDNYKFDLNTIVKANGNTITQYSNDNIENLFDILEGKKEGFVAFNNSVALCLMFTNYKIIEGSDVTINVDDNKDVLFVSNAPFSKFKEVQVDNTVITKETDYTVTEGSTKVTLKSTYLNTLANGKHTLSIISTDGQASITFTITRNQKPSPNPGYVVPKTGVK